MRVVDWLLGRPLTEHRALDGWDLGRPVPPVGLPNQGAWFGRDYRRLVPAVYRARNGTVNVVGQLPLRLEGDRERTPALLRRPDPDQTRQGFVRETVASLVDYGNCYWRIIRFNGSGPVALKVTDPNDWVVTWNDDRTRRLYKWRGQPMQPGVDMQVLAIGRGPYDLRGLGPMQHDRIRGVFAALEYSQQYFLQGAEPSGILYTESEVTDSEAEIAVQRWAERHQPGTRTPGFLSGGLKWQSGGLSPKDSEWTGTHGAGILDVAQIFGVPARILGYSQPGSSLTYSNESDVYLSWWRETLGPEYAAPIEEAFSAVIPGPATVRFDPTELLRGDVATRWGLALDAIDRGAEPRATFARLDLGELPFTTETASNGID